MLTARPARLVALALVLVCAGLAAGCSHTERVGSSRTLRVALTEYRLNPEGAVVSAGVVTVLVHNDGRLIHNLAVSMNGQTVESTKPIPPGGSAAMVLTLAPGSYLMYSSLLSDQALGQYGTLTVTP